jgi:hypothetical protein
MTKEPYLGSNRGESREKKWHELINDDCLRVVSEYLSIQEFKNLCLTSKEIRKTFSLQCLWRDHCFQRWNWKGNIFQKWKDFDGMTLYPSVSALCHQILLPEMERIQIKSDLTIEYNGSIGESNQSVKATQHFPPLYLDNNAEQEGLSWSIRALTSLLCGCKKKSKSFACSSRTFRRSFSTPYYDPLRQCYHIEPRQVAYYEITILSSSSTSSLFDDENDCIAIGLSTEAFSLVKFMPGWNSESYGYHSDDGAIFHGRGSPYSSYGPKFGVGDIVGCGLRYDTNEIFFTLNGKSLGTAFKNVSGKLYPTVGVDAQVQITFNFGLNSFCFSLAEFSRSE